MEIIQLNLKHFGKFTDYRLDLHAGINIISGGNETGKSTLHAFIRAMLYGVTRNRSKSLDEYQLREPWDNPGYFAGSMKLLYDGKIYRIDRNFQRSQESVEVVCETDGTKEEDPSSMIRRFTGGLDEGDFDNTVFIRQAQTISGDKLCARLRDYLVNRETAADDSLDVSASLDYLKKKRKKIENDKNAALSSIEKEISEKHSESEYISSDLERLLEKRSNDTDAGGVVSPFERVGESGGEISAEQDDIREKDGIKDNPGQDNAAGGNAAEGGGKTKGGEVREPDAEDEAPETFPPDEGVETSGVLMPVMVLLSFAAAVMMCACAFLAPDIKMRFLTGAGALLAGAVAILLLWRLLHPVSKSERVMRRLKREDFLNRTLGFRDDPDDPAGRAEQMRREERSREAILRARQEEEREAYLAEEKRRARLDKLIEIREKEDMEKRGRDVARIARSQVLDREITLRREKLDELRSSLEELYRKKASLSSYDEEIRAIDLARKRISDLSGSIYHESGAGFEREVSSMLSMLTLGRYTRISLDEKNLVRLNTPDRLLTLEQVSFGTMQQVYLALRLSSAYLLAEDASVPVILDEPFAMYDEEHLKSALKLLSAGSRQVILFTCQTRELDILYDIKRGVS